jgi:tetratricopeptide (TPR) repeat protein
VQPQIAGHPFKFFIDVYGILHSADRATLKKALQEPQVALTTSTFQQLDVYLMEQDVQSNGPESAQNFWGCIFNNTDWNSFDDEETLNYSEGQESSEWGKGMLSTLRKISPESPMWIADQIRGNWNDAKAAKWETSHGDYPSVALALGEKYTKLNRWPEAERNIRQYISVSPDQRGYEDLANIYKFQFDDARWLSTLKDYLSHGQDYGLQFAHVQQEIAEYYMQKGDYSSAIPYADAAADTEANWAMLCAADAHTGIGDWSGAERLIRKAMDHYSSSPSGWYAWCQKTGHGDFAAAKQAMQDYYGARRERLTAEDLLQLGIFQICEGQNTEALETFKQRFARDPGPLSLVHMMIINDLLHDKAGFKATVEQFPRVSDDAKLTSFVSVLEKAGDGVADAASIDAIANGAEDKDRISINAMAAVYFDDRGQTEAANHFLLEGARIQLDGYGDRILIDAKLQKRGIDPLKAAATTTPSNTN